MNLLAPFGMIYGRVMDVRNALYDRGTFKSFPLGARTISIGNLTTGGTGKTPLVALVAKLLLDAEEKPCILTRGYGRKDPRNRVVVSDGEQVLVDAEVGGDEPVELAMKLSGKAVIVADADRVAAAKWALSEFAPTAFILDDGFQHRRAQRDLDIVCIDATNPCGNGKILPAGSLRESYKSLERADAIVITRTELVEDTANLEQRLRDRNSRSPIFRARSVFRGLCSIEDIDVADQPIREAEGSLFAFTGLGNPDQFFRSLKASSVSVTGQKAFPDHHKFTQADIDALEVMSEETGAIGLVTTAKDAVKLPRLRSSITCYVAIAETVIEDPAFEALILTA